jgi:hypothetical protein
MREADIMLDITQDDINSIASRLKELYEFTKTVVIPIEENKTLCNEEAIAVLEEQLKKVESERDKVYQRIFKELPITLAFGIFPGLNYLALGGCGLILNELSIEGKITKDVYSLALVLRVSRLLLEKYKDKNIEIYPRIFIPEYGHLDIFIKFPAPYKKSILMALSSVSKEHRVYFHVAKNKLYRRTTVRLKGSKEYDASKISEFKLQEGLLRKSHRHLFGSLRDSKRPMLKFFAVCNPYKPPTEEDPGRSFDHKTKFKLEFPEEKWTEIGSKKFPFIATDPTVYAITEEMIPELIDCWLE